MFLDGKSGLRCECLSRLVNSWVMELCQKEVAYRFGMPQATQDLNQRSCERYSFTLVWIRRLRCD